MNIYTGKTVYKGIALGPIHLFKREAPIKRRKIADSRAESERLAAAVEAAKGELQALYDKAAAEVGEDSAAIFEVHRMMLDDEDFRAAVQNLIEKESVNAEYAVSVTGDNFAEMFAGMDDEYMKARASDVRDIARRLVRCLRGERGESGADLPPSIIVADDLTPSETVQLDKGKILAFVTAHGSFNSHTSILARTMNIPALIGVPFEAGMLREGALAAVDGYRGEFIAEPDGETLAAAVISDELAQHGDFFSIGTNDLTQYTLAADRQNEKLEGFCNPHHEAILRLIEMTVKNGHKAGIWVGICGELGADLSLTREFIRMGVDELSVSPAMILKLRKNIVEMNAD